MPKPTIDLPDIPDGWLDAPAQGLPQTRSRSLWAQLSRSTGTESGEAGSGYYTYGTDKTGRTGTTVNAQWGLPKTMQVIAAVASQLGNGRQYTPFGVGNISLKDGADFRPDHRGHRDGMGIDVRPARADGAQKGVTYLDNQYDREATQRLVDAFHATGQVSKIFFNDPKIRGVQPLKKHDNHLHVQLKPGE